MPTISEGVRSGHLPGLEAIRDRLAQDLDECRSLRDGVAIARLLMENLRQIAELVGPAGSVKETGLSDFEKRLRERESSAKGSRSAGNS